MSLLSERQLTRYRVPLLAVACLQAFFTSGIFYGWASLYALFLDSGVYSHLCPAGSTDVCAAQKDKLAFIYTVASSVNLCSQLPWGLVLDFLGPRVCNLWSTAMVIVGFVLLSLSARGVFDGFMLAMILIGGAGPGAQISLFHLSELFPLRQKSTVLSIVTGAFQLGFVVFLLWQLASARLGLDVSTLSLLYCVPLTLLLLLGGVLWPDAPCIPASDSDPLSFTSREPLGIKDEQGNWVYSKIGQAHARSEAERQKAFGHEEEDSAQEAEEAEVEDGERALLWREDKESTLDQSIDGDHGSRTSSITSAPAVPPVAGAEEEQPLVLNLRADEYEDEPLPIQEGTPLQQRNYGSLPDPSSSPSLHHVHRSLHALKASRSLPNLKGMTASNPFGKQLCSPSFLLCLLWMCICIFWANFYIGTCVEQLYVLSDGDMSATRHYTSLFTLLLPSGLVGIGVFGYLTDVLGFSASSAVTSALGVGFALASLELPLAWQPLTFVLYSFFRAFLFSCMFAYLAHEFGYRHFGLLSGILLLVGGGMGTLQYPLARAWVQGKSAGARGGCEGLGCQNASFDRVHQLQLAMLLSTFFFPLYVYVKQRMRATRVEEQIEQHTRHLASVY